MDVIEEFSGKVRGRGLSVVLPEGRDERIIRAARRIRDLDIARPIVLGKAERIAAACEAAGMGLDGIETLDPWKNEKLDAYAEKYIEGRNDITHAVARRILRRPVFYAGMMVACGDADVAVGGAATATAVLIQAAVLTAGLIEGVETPSSYFLMVVPKFLGQTDK